VKPQEQIIFTHLKEAVATAFLENHSAPSSVEHWKGEDIVTFQEELRVKVKATVSEKWFYTYMKNDIDKLPRIDMLNLLSKYVGFQNWNDFKYTHLEPHAKSKKRSFFKKYRWALYSLIIFLLVIYKLNAKNNFHFCFEDETKIGTIKSYLDIKILKDTESPIFLKTDSLGCFSYATKESIVRFVVESPYYKTDTIIRSINTNGTGKINLDTDDYALMLQYYTKGNLKDWKKRKAQLKMIIADDAQIYQVYPAGIGIELYSKDDFIDKLTVPTESLKNMKILDKSYKNGQIIKLKFMVK